MQLSDCTCKDKKIDVVKACLCSMSGIVSSYMCTSLCSYTLTVIFAHLDTFLSVGNLTNFVPKNT